MMVRMRLRTPSLRQFLQNVVYSFLLTILVVVILNAWLDKYSVLNDLTQTSLEFMHYKETPSKELSSAEVRHFINKYNQEETILNLGKFGHLKKDMIIIVVQVHKYKESFKYLLASLCEVIGIQDTLLVFSHAYIDKNVNKLIQSIDFCRVLQIFYPYSLQAYAHEFPGYDENDCPHGMHIENAKLLNCTGAYTPDSHGRYRDPIKAEQKHFWWWTINKVFQNLSFTEKHTGEVVFLEDDLYLMQDFLYMIIHMRRVAKSLPQCEIISIKTDPSIMYEDVYRVEVSTWVPRHPSSVLALDTSAFRTIVAHYDLFCTVDDTSWSRSLLYLSLNRKENKMLKAVYSTMPRVIKTSCSHAVLGICNVLENVLQALTIQKQIKTGLFPPYLDVYTHIELDNEEYLIFNTVDGGWRDPRDINLCTNITMNKVIKLLSDMEFQFQDNYFS